jgi:hypothetical protein
MEHGDKARKARKGRAEGRLEGVRGQRTEDRRQETEVKAGARSYFGLGNADFKKGICSVYRSPLTIYHLPN